MNPLKIRVDEGISVAALLDAPRGATNCFVMAHGAGAGMTHPFLASVAQALTARGVAVLRFQFPFVEAGSKRPDAPALAMATVRAAVAEASRRLPRAALFAGGKSFGGRMASNAQANEPLEGVCGLAFLGFPLHPAARPSTARAEHLRKVRIPMLFLQGRRDALADAALVASVVGGLGRHAQLRWIDDADHAFHVRVRSGRTDALVIEELASHLAEWMEAARFDA